MMVKIGMLFDASKQDIPFGSHYSVHIPFFPARFVAQDKEAKFSACVFCCVKRAFASSAFTGMQNEVAGAHNCGRMLQPEKKRIPRCWKRAVLHKYMYAPLTEPCVTYASGAR